MGKTNEEIGINLALAANTKKKHLEIIFQKLGVEHRTATPSMPAISSQMKTWLTTGRTEK